MQDNQTATVTANTGKNDPNSIWGTGLIGNILTTGTGIFGALQQTDAEKAKAKANADAAKAATAQANNTSKLITWGIVGAVLVVALVVVVALFKKK